MPIAYVESLGRRTTGTLEADLEPYWSGEAPPPMPAREDCSTFASGKGDRGFAYLLGNGKSLSYASLLAADAADVAASRATAPVLAKFAALAEFILTQEMASTDRRAQPRLRKVVG